MNTNPIPYRIRVGVIGHRKLEHPETIAEQIRQVLNTRIPELFDDYPKVPLLKKESKAKTTIQFCVITVLAEGADRLVAEEVLKTPEPTLEAVLPLVQKDYMTDFTDKQSKREFEELLKKDPSPRVLREKPLKDLYLEYNEKQLKEERINAYFEAGEYVVDHCDVLIAIWDGQEAKGRGGTGDIVAYARKRSCPLVIIPTNNSDALCDSVIIEKGRVEENEKGNIQNENDRIGLSYKDFCRLEKYNTHYIKPTKQTKEEEKNARDFLGSTNQDLIHDVTRKRILETILPEYTRASIIAQDNQRWYFLAGLLAYVLSPLAVFAVVLGIHFPQKIGHWAFIIELLILLFILYVIFIANQKKVHKKWIEARFLSERLRSSIFLVMFGVKPTNFSRDIMRRTTLLNVGWPMRAYYEILSNYGPSMSTFKFTLNGARETIRTKWIDPQIKYHQDKVNDSGKKSRILELGGRMVFGAAVVAASTHVVLSFIAHDKTPVHVENGIIALTILLPAFGSAIGAIRTHREYSHLEKRSIVMKSNLEDLQLIYDKIKTHEQFIQVLQYTDEIMLQENEDWLRLMKPVDLTPI